jgi:hypothetical protein
VTRGGKPKSRSRAGQAAAGSPFDQLFAGAANLLETDDPVEAEFFASTISALPELPSPSRVVRLDEALVGAFVEEARRRGTPAALALVLALAHVAPPDWDDAAERAARELLAAGVKPPPWAESIGTASFAGAWLGTEPFGDQEVLFVSFQHQGQSPHALQLLIDQNVNGVIKDAQLVPAVAELLERWREGMPEMAFRQLNAGEASTRLAAGLEMSDLPWLEPPWTSDFRALRTLIGARLRLLPQPTPRPEPEPMADELRAKLVGDFLGSPEGEAARKQPEGRRLAEALVDYRADHSDGDPLRWSPVVVELFMNGYPRKVAMEADDVERLPEVLRSWVRYAGRRRGLSPDLVEETLEAVARFEPDLRLGALGEASDQARGDPDREDAVVPLFGDNEEDEEDEDDVDEFVAALEEEETQALELMRDALPEARSLPPPPEFKAVVARLRRELPRAGRLRPTKRAAGWKRLPEDDRELWLGTVGALIAMREDSGLDAEDESTIMAMETGDWLGAVVGLVRDGIGADAEPGALVEYINSCPEIDGEVEPEDAELVEYAFELVLPAWEAAGAVTPDRRLTALGRWGLPRALAWAWGHDFDA